MAMASSFGPDSVASQPHPTAETDEARWADEEQAAPRVLKPRRAAPADAVRPTRAEINLGHLRHNLRVLERVVRADPTLSPPKIWGVLKADGYGHGASAIARTLERTHIDGLSVALLEEAIDLRDAGIQIPILVMGGYYGRYQDGFDAMLEHRLTPVVYEPGQIERLSRHANLRQETVGVHFKIDTGMGRLGALGSQLNDCIAAFNRHPGVRIDGFMTHFACADEDDLDLTRHQLEKFHRARKTVTSNLRLTNTPLLHASNSAAMLRLPEARLDAVRPGIALFGVEPKSGVAKDLKPVMRVRTEIVALRTIESGKSIGYGQTWTASRRSVIATMPIGYADGLSRLLSNRGHGLVRGKRAPIAGTVSMDLTMIDVTDIPGVDLNDEVVVLGSQEGPLGKDSISAVEIAELCGTIPWEVLTSISRRVPRFYREP